MTEASYQQARTLMRQITYLKGQITTQKKIMLAYGNKEADARAKGDDDKAIAAMNGFNKAADEVKRMKATMAAIVFPSPNLPDEVIDAKFCRICQAMIAKAEEYCLDCNSNQNLAKYDFSHRKELSE